MKNLDSAISQMNMKGCHNCSLSNATYDETGEEVNIEGSFCGIPVSNTMIQLTAYRKEDNAVIWTNECETGKTCSIPFTSKEDFICYSTDESEE